MFARTILLLLGMGTVNGFRPNHESGGIAPGDFTDADITEKGILKAVSWFMETSALPGKSPKAPGELDDKNPTELFKAYFEADVSPDRFVKALEEIVKGNNQVEVDNGEDSSYFFYCGDIAKSIAQLRALRKAMLASLVEPVTLAGLESARLNAGKALHVLQKFYSNTNWVEMGNDDIYEFLINEDSDVKVPIAPASIATCKNCVKSVSGVYTCVDNILIKDMIVSGYKISATCKTKPQGRCGHGGKDDATQDTNPTGGINKETSDPKLSPHAHLHKKAAELAIQATKNFFVEGDASLLTMVDKDIFRKFFNLEGYSLVFVIDTTGSMGDDIAQVKEKSIQLIQKFSTLPDAPFNYIVVPFNDPDHGPAFKTHNVNELKNYISRLTVDGGDDCPEMSLSGLKLALDESLPSSKIYSFTDASAKDEHLKEQVKIKIDATLSEVNYLLTGTCSKRKRGSVTKRIARDSERGYENIYEEIATYSGGFYVLTTKPELSRVLGVMELSLNAAPVKVTQARLDGTRFSFPVDETLTEITVSVKNMRSSRFSMTIRTPSGATARNTKTLIDTTNHKIVKVSPIQERGSWTVTVSPSSSYEVEIGGKSLLDFSYQIMQKQRDYMLPIQGRPIKGSSYAISLKMLGDAKGVKVKHLVSISERGTARSVPLNQTSDALGNVLAIATLPFDSSMSLLKVEGLSPNNLPFSRVSSSPIRTESVEVLPLPGQKGTMSPGETLRLSVVVVNDGTPASFSFKVWDDRSFLRSFSPKSSFLRTGQNITLTATFEAPVRQDKFVSSIATFTAESSTAQNYLKLPIAVITETALETDITPPGYNLMQLKMPCAEDSQNQPECFRHIWRMTFSVKDDHSDVNVKVNPNPTGVSCHPAGTDGDKDVICDYKSTCCAPWADVLIIDGRGNAEAFTVDYNTTLPTAAR
ncbi:von Willebrand factor A domain-containing protein 7 isoform X2 [Anolis carolinensis]|uniref:von Willebrand factor A domain-containing protein 7 isoform X2 n=1 Tax=Anolis carolinensis TaxID=28377 RepID=UPI002F2B65C5